MKGGKEIENPNGFVNPMEVFEVLRKCKNHNNNNNNNNWNYFLMMLLVLGFQTSRLPPNAALRATLGARASITLGCSW